MKRRQSREYALQILFQHDFTAKDPVFDAFWNGLDADEDGIRYTNGLVTGTLKRLEEIDQRIKKAAEHWVLERMAAVDRNILRLATYEICYVDDVPPAVAINEALEIAKKFSAIESVPFINGILDKIARAGA